MKIGDLNKYVTIQYPTRVSDATGGFTTTWADWGNVWAALWPTTAKEIALNGQATMTVTHKIRIRYRAEVKPFYRIKYGNKYFSITSIVNINTENRWLDLLCNEVV